MAQPWPERGAAAVPSRQRARRRQVSRRVLREAAAAGYPSPVTSEIGKGLADVPVRRVLLFGCGVVFLLVGVAAVVFLARSGDLLARALDRHEQRLASRLPEGLPEAERTRLAWAFEDAEAAMRDGYADDAALERVQARLAALTAELEAVAGRAREDGGPP